jgi:hypothetical protein
MGVSSDDAPKALSNNKMISDRLLDCNSKGCGLVKSLRKSDIAARHPDVTVVVLPRSSAVPNETAEIKPTQRDRHLQVIADDGRMGWQKRSGYNLRVLVEADTGRRKRVIGHALRSRTDARQVTEVAIAVNVLNHMLMSGRPSYVRIT